jgi:hypothetical protein
MGLRTFGGWVLLVKESSLVEEDKLLVVQEMSLCVKERGYE